jgi:hypothetical protein
MHKLSKNILSLLLVGMFVLSLTGLRMFVHHCSGCDVSRVSFFAPAGDCCDADPLAICSIDPEMPSSCCETPPEGTGCDDCCHDEVHYLTNDYELTYNRHQTNIEPQILFIIAVLLHEGFDYPDIQKIPSVVNEFSDPPPGFTGKDFIIYSHQIKIC